EILAGNVLGSARRISQCPCGDHEPAHAQHPSIHLGTTLLSSLKGSQLLFQVECTISIDEPLDGCLLQRQSSVREKLLQERFRLRAVRAHPAYCAYVDSEKARN